MYSAPSVTYPVGRSFFFGGMVAALWLAGALSAVLWCLQPAGIGWRQGLALAAVGIAGIAAVRGWRALPTGRLRWDGQTFLWGEGAVDDMRPGAVAVALDLQRRLLLSWRPAGARGMYWLCAERGADPQRWDDLRRAVYSRAITDAPPHDTSEAAPS